MTPTPVARQPLGWHSWLAAQLGELALGPLVEQAATYVRHVFIDPQKRAPEGQLQAFRASEHKGHEYPDLWMNSIVYMSLWKLCHGVGDYSFTGVPGIDTQTQQDINELWAYGVGWMDDTARGAQFCLPGGNDSPDDYGQAGVSNTFSLAMYVFVRSHFARGKEFDLGTNLEPAFVSPAVPVQAVRMLLQTRSGNGWWQTQARADGRGWMRDAATGDERTDRYDVQATAVAVSALGDWLVTIGQHRRWQFTRWLTEKGLLASNLPPIHRAAQRDWLLRTSRHQFWEDDDWLKRATELRWSEADRAGLLTDELRQKWYETAEVAEAAVAQRNGVTPVEWIGLCQSVRQARDDGIGQLVSARLDRGDWPRWFDSAANEYGGYGDILVACDVLYALDRFGGRAGKDVSSLVDDGCSYLWREAGLSDPDRLPLWPSEHQPGLAAGQPGGEEDSRRVEEVARVCAVLFRARYAVYFPALLRGLSWLLRTSIRDAAPDPDGHVGLKHVWALYALIEILRRHDIYQQGYEQTTERMLAPSRDWVPSGPLGC
ncbi:MAG: hypothetical protein HZB16_21410 [Armatimonadetes bacterium]|nr:hypothetical protein [Armatimonadota bacterium]